MNRVRFPSLLWVEVQAVLRGGAARAAMVLAALVAVAAVMAMDRLGATINAADGANATNVAGVARGGLALSGARDVSSPYAAGWALSARNFYVLPMLLLLAGAQATAGELGRRTLREDLVRPVSRTRFLAARFMALAVLSGLTLLISMVVSLGAGSILLGTKGPWGAVVLGHLASWLSDMGLLAGTVLVGLWVRSAGGVVVIVLLALLADMVLRVGLGILATTVPDLAWLVEVIHVLPGTVLASWKGWRIGWDPVALGALVGWTLTMMALAWRRFTRMDIP